MDRFLILLTALTVGVFPAKAQNSPYFVTYDHHMEEPGNLEISHQNTIGRRKQNLPTFWAPLLELEYGVAGWWSSALYIEGARQAGDNAVFTGFRIENRFKPLKGEHIINPVLYFEFENITEATRIRKEIVGHAGTTDEKLSDLSREKARELEGKIILSSNAKGWNLSENFIVEKNLSAAEGVEFGYALGISRPFASMATGKNCRFCRENLTVGLELYGGLGSTEQFGFRETAHYLAPTLAWQISENSLIRVSPGLGLTRGSDRMLLRVGYMFEINGFGPKLARMFRGK